MYRRGRRKREIGRKVKNTTIMKNTLTEKMMEYLLMPDEKLQVHSGPSSPQSYRQSVMLAITYFWN